MGWFSSIKKKVKKLGKKVLNNSAVSAFAGFIPGGTLALNSAKAAVGFLPKKDKNKKNVPKAASGFTFGGSWELGAKKDLQPSQESPSPIVLVGGAALVAKLLGFF